MGKPPAFIAGGLPCGTVAVPGYLLVVMGICLMERKVMLDS